MLEWRILFAHQSIVPAPDVPEAMMSRAQSPLLWRLATTTPVAPAVVVNVLLVHVTGFPPLFWYHATPVAAFELLATISRSPSRSMSATARLVTPVAAASMVNAVHVPVGVHGVEVQGFLYHVMVLPVLAAWTTSRKPSPSMSASQMSLEPLGQGGAPHAPRLASVKGVQVGGSPPPLMY